MAIWSLTQERVEKLMRQIGDKEAEIDALIKLTPKDLWNIDLDAFVEEWNVQLTEEADRAKKIQRMGRRASHKLGIGASKGGKGKKKRKMGDSDSEEDSDDDFGPVKKKAKPKKDGLLSYLREADPPAKKTAPAETAKAAPKQTNLLSHLVKPEAKKESPPLTDRPSSPDEEEAAAPSKAVPAVKPRGRTAAVKKPTPVISDDDNDDSDVFAVVAKEEAKKPAPAPKANGRAPRAATKPISRYAVDSDSDDDDDLGDVSTMVKTIGGSANGVPMFKVSTRPGSSSGMPKIAKKASPSVIDIDEGDTTNYEALMPKPSSPRQSALRDATLMSDSEDDFSLVKPKPATTKLTKIPAKPKPAAKAKAPAAVVAKKSTALSPAAKAYAARLEKTSGAAKAKLAVKKPTLVDSDEEMDDADALANDILSDDDDEDEPTPKPKATGRAPAARPGRRAAAKPAKYVVSDDDDEDEASEASFDEDSE